MTDCINRIDALNAVQDALFFHSYAGGIAANALLKLPAADVQEAKWVMIESRPMDEEERAYYSEQIGYDIEYEDAVIYCCQLPEHGQEVLVCNKYGNIWIDTFDDDPDYGVGFETNGDMDGIVAWMPLPKPPKEEQT